MLIYFGRVFTISSPCMSNSISGNGRFSLSQYRHLRNSVFKLQRSRGRVKKFEPLEPPLEGLPLQTGSGTPLSAPLWKPLIFTAAFSTASLAGASIWHYENIRAKAQSKLFNQPMQWFQGTSARNEGKWMSKVKRWWNSLPDAEKMFIPLCLANVLVFLAWKVPSFQPSMIKYFCSNPGSSTACWPMVLSIFSHYSTLHIFANMYVLHSFSRGIVGNMGMEQFLGFYLTAGVIASMASYMHKVAFNKPGLSLGASGAIMGVLGYTCTQFPDLNLSIIFLPFFTFKAAAALKVIMGIDALGIIMGWKFLDHAAHLGGALFGVFWSYWGHQHIWNNRKSVVSAWHNIRGPP